MNEPYFSLEVTNVDAGDDTDRSNPVDLMFGTVGTLTVIAGGQRWQADLFPVLELAFAISQWDLARLGDHEFSSMDIETEPAITLRVDGEQATLTLLDEFTCTAPASAVRGDLERLVAVVDGWTRAATGHGVTETAKLARYRVAPEQGR